MPNIGDVLTIEQAALRLVVAQMRGITVTLAGDGIEESPNARGIHRHSSVRGVAAAAVQ